MIYSTGWWIILEAFFTYICIFYIPKFQQQLKAVPWREKRKQACNIPDYLSVCPQLMYLKMNDLSIAPWWHAVG